jgi:hypothetical protein
MKRINRKTIARQIVAELTTVHGEWRQGTRLAVKTDSGEYLGGWCLDAAIDAVYEILKKHVPSKVK